MSNVVIYHNPSCSKSRQTLALLREQNIEPEIIEYLQTPLDAATIGELTAKLGMEPDELIRSKEYRALGLPETNDPQELLARMAAHPEVIQRPIVVNGPQARLGRPPERVLEIL